MKGINCERRIYTDKLNTHSHSFAQLILPLEGMLYIETKYKELMLDEDHLFLVPPDSEHTFKAHKSNEFLVLDIPDHMVIKNHMDKMAGGSKFVFDDKWKAVRFLLLNEIDNKKSSSSINNLFNYFYDFIANDNISDSVKYINEHFTEDIDLKTLAEIEHYNINYYSEWFKKNMNVSPKEYIQKLRVKKAKKLLMNSDFTILQIAQMVGYNHNSSLTRIFKDLEKVTPADYRKRIRK
ncbi:AraC family transcriptional regulator [Anaeromicrobium sediminis]|uniref:AraC family transcriptional regulator n=1 Tax=Anaeromicrobium sediminis TaxID=1478221 RepID=A0A267MMX1_9FIRM|nr:AraC family transcriptional regulator [Anaeromicrobium sediminis]PAB60100.1 AraC family transcriptional regulator [Anaeromicrobium sediminis]